MNAAEFPNNERRILYNSDGGGTFGEFIQHTGDPDEAKAILEQSIDELAEAGVDTLALCVTTRFIARIGPS